MCAPDSEICHLLKSDVTDSVGNCVRVSVRVCDSDKHNWAFVVFIGYICKMSMSGAHCTTASPVAHCLCRAQDCAKLCLGCLTKNIKQNTYTNKNNVALTAAANLAIVLAKVGQFWLSSFVALLIASTSVADCSPKICAGHALS